jgi:hypothetical protein
LWCEVAAFRKHEEHATAAEPGGGLGDASFTFRRIVGVEHGMGEPVSQEVDRGVE